jgi:hypothetical protein
MTRDDITRMAREAGLHLATDVNWMPIIGLEYAEKFASLVIANNPPQSFMSWQEGYAAGATAARAEEREACAKVCEDRPTGTAFDNRQACADAIRARGNI